ncbi:hypothetical protein DMENIID0001_112100 [Sergentomyia squamirostris]
MHEGIFKFLLVILAFIQRFLVFGQVDSLIANSFFLEIVNFSIFNEIILEIILVDEVCERFQNLIQDIFKLQTRRQRKKLDILHIWRKS